MDWTSIIVALIAAGGSFLASYANNNKHMAILETKLDSLKEELTKQGNRIDQHNHLNERITKLEVQMEERKGGGAA